MLAQKGASMNDEILEMAREYQKWKKLTRGRGTIIPDSFIDEFKNLYKKYQDDNLYKKIGVTKYSWDKRVLGKLPTQRKKTESFVLLPKRSNKNSNNNNNSVPTPLFKVNLKNGTEIILFQC